MRWLPLACATLCANLVAADPNAFTVADDIEFATFVDLDATDGPVLFSPDRSEFAVQTERGRIDINRPESSVRIYRSAAVGQWLHHGGPTPEPQWTFNLSAYRNGPNISRLRWLRDSSALVFLGKSATGDDQLIVADVAHRTLLPLSIAGQSVKTFDVVDSATFAYTVSIFPATTEPAETENVTVESAEDLVPLLFPAALQTDVARSSLCALWVAHHGHAPELVIERSTGLPFKLQGFNPLTPVVALSPDGGSVITTLGVPNVPESWEKNYPPPFSPNANHVRAGHQDLSSPSAQAALVRQYVAISVSDGTARPLLDAPVADTAGWWYSEDVHWSATGTAVVLSNAFMPRRDAPSTRDESRPCIVVLDMRTAHAQCVVKLSGYTPDGIESGYREIEQLRLLDAEQLLVIYRPWNGSSFQDAVGAVYHQGAHGRWLPADRHPGSNGLRVRVEQSISAPPKLIASVPITRERQLWDPNPRLKDLDLGVVRELSWTDATGRPWRGGLYLPSIRVARPPYPLIIQNHGFPKSRFVPSGMYTSVNAAREFTSVGIAVLQVQDCTADGLNEGACQISGYEAAVAALARQGLIDSGRLGIMGFSRTCYYVLQALTRSTLSFKAALIANGVDGGYLQSMILPATERDAEGINGGPPFGATLKTWLANSPMFNLKKIVTPLRIEASEGPLGLLLMWEPYALLTYMHKPVDLIYYTHAGTHPLTNPAQRLASQGGSVDWFRFWLQDYEEARTDKAMQYARWRELRRIQQDR